MSEGTVLVQTRELRPAAERRPFIEHSLIQLTLVRFREFWREPEAVFWVFVFPLLLTTGLGIAFRNRPADVVKVGAVGPQLAEAMRTNKSLSVELLDRAAGEQALRAGRIVLLAVPAADGAGIWGLGFAIVDARRKKLLKRLIASPMPRSQYLLSFLLARLAMLYVEVAALIGFGAWVFGVPVRGSLWELAILCLLSSLSFSALGLLIASRVRTIEGASGLMNFIMLPMWIFSGVFFSSDRFPNMLQPFVRALPLTAVIDALRAQILQGVSLTHLTAQLAVITGWLVVCFFTALKLFRWR